MSTDKPLAIVLMILAAALIAAGMALTSMDPAVQRAGASASTAPPAAAAPAGAPAAPASASPPSAPAAPLAAGPTVKIMRVAQVPGDDPGDPAWNAAAPVDVPLMPQMMAMPAMETPSVASVNLQGIADGNRIAFRLTWSDKNADMNVDSGRFCDAAAIQFPLNPAAPPMMGVRGMKVQVLHWKALWQKDVDEHFQDVQDLHPNYWSDHYWFAKASADAPVGSVPYRVPGSFEDPRGHAWFIAYSAGNPVAEIHRKQPVEELVAEGYGTLTRQSKTATTGRGFYKDGRWSVVFSRPMKTDDPLDFQFAPGTGTTALAIWEGASGNIGGRKHWTNWVNFEVAP